MLEWLTFISATTAAVFQAAGLTTVTGSFHGWRGGEGAARDVGERGHAELDRVCWHPSADDALARWLDARRALGLSARRRLFCTLARGPRCPTTTCAACCAAWPSARASPSACICTGCSTPSPSRSKGAGTPGHHDQQAAGHSSVAVTARYLDHLTNGQAVTALENTDLPSL
jgi:hypothetical protein